MNIILNGKQISTQTDTLAELIREQDFKPDSLIIELNRNLVAKENWQTVHISEGDTLELLNFVGGG